MYAVIASATADAPVPHPADKEAAVIASTGADAPVPHAADKEAAVIARSVFCDEAISVLLRSGIASQKSLAMTERKNGQQKFI